MLFSWYKVAYEKKRTVMRNVASVAELTEAFFAEIDKSRSVVRLTAFGRATCRWRIVIFPATGHVTLSYILFAGLARVALVVADFKGIRDG